MFFFLNNDYCTQLFLALSILFCCLNVWADSWRKLQLRVVTVLISIKCVGDLRARHLWTGFRYFNVIINVDYTDILHKNIQSCFKQLGQFVEFVGFYRVSSLYFSFKRELKRTPKFLSIIQHFKCFSTE